MTTCRSNGFVNVEPNNGKKQFNVSCSSKNENKEPLSLFLLLCSCCSDHGSLSCFPALNKKNYGKHSYTVFCNLFDVENVRYFDAIMK